MRNIIVDDIYEIIDEIMELYERDSKKLIAVVGYYETVMEVMNMALKMNDDLKFVGGELESPEYDSYDEAYYLEINDCEMYCGKMYNEKYDRYLLMEPDYAYIEEDFLDPYLDTNSPDGVCVFGFDDVHENDSNDDYNGCLCKTDDGYGFTFCGDVDGGHYKFTYRGTKKLTDDMIHELLHEYVFD